MLVNLTQPPMPTLETATSPPAHTTVRTHTLPVPNTLNLNGGVSIQPFTAASMVSHASAFAGATLSRGGKFHPPPKSKSKLLPTVQARPPFAHARPLRPRLARSEKVG